jgi:two-component sensor histidine kinase
MFDRLPALRDVNRDLLLVVLTALLWMFDLGWELVMDVFYPWHVGASIRTQVESAIVMHLLFLPLMLLCYLVATRISQFIKYRTAAFLAHAGLALGLASLTCLFVNIGIYLVTGDINAAGTHYANLLQAGFDLGHWLEHGLIMLTVYLLGLFLILGMNARLDLENERIRTSNLHALWLNARLDTLRGQLNPHFLFNSLHTISSLLLTDPRRADKLLADFSDVLRITLREGQREFTTVREELDYARHYLSIEGTRFEDRLKIRFAVDDGSLDAQVPSLILQPLIENAIKHGISNCAGANAVDVEVHRGGDTLVMEVSNDFHAGDLPVAPERKMGIGLNNVRERLLAIYGGNYTLSSLGLPGDRWSTRISFPYREVLGA